MVNIGKVVNTRKIVLVLTTFYTEHLLPPSIHASHGVGWTEYFSMLISFYSANDDHLQCVDHL